MSQDSNLSATGSHNEHGTPHTVQRCDHCEATDRELFEHEHGFTLCQKCLDEYVTYNEMEEKALAELTPQIEAFVQACRERGLPDLAMLDIVSYASGTATTNATGSPEWKIREAARNGPASA